MDTVALVLLWLNHITSDTKEKSIILTLEAVHHYVV